MPRLRVIDAKTSLKGPPPLLSRRWHWVVVSMCLLAGLVTGQENLPQDQPLVAADQVSTAPFAKDRQSQATAASGQPTAVFSGAGPDLPEEAPATDRVSAADVEQRLKDLETIKDVDELTKEEILKKYQAAQDWLRIAAEAAAKTAAHEADVQQAPQLLAEARATLAQPAAEPQIVVPSDVKLVQIEQCASEAQTAFKAAQESLAKREESLQLRAARKAEVNKLVEETKTRLEEARKQLTTSAAAGEPSALANARRTELDARLLALENQLAMHKAEIARHDVRAEVVPLLRDIAKREKSLREAHVAEWEKVVTKFRKQESQRQAEEAQRQVQDAHPALKVLAERNAALAEQRKSLADSIALVGQQAASVEKEVDELESQLKKAKHRVSRAGHSATVGLMLRRQSEDLPSKRECQSRLHRIQHETQKANRALIDIEEERDLLGDAEDSRRKL